MKSGRDIFAEKYAAGLEEEAKWLQLGAGFKATSIEQLCRAVNFSPGSILEVGAGTGAVLKELKRRGLGVEHMAMDFSADALAHLRETDAGIRTLEADITAIASTVSCDLVVCTHVLEHLERPETALHSICEKISARYYIFEVPLEDLFLGRMRNSFGYRNKNAAGHVQFYSTTSFRALIGSRFKIREELIYFPKFSEEEAHEFPHRGSAFKKLLKNLTQNILPTLVGSLWTRTWYGHMAILAEHPANNEDARMHAHQKCPLCGNDLSKSLGRIFHREPVQVAGVSLDLGSDIFSLVECGTCGVQIKSPQIPETRLLECYARASNSNWGEDPNPVYRHFDKILQLAEKFAQGNRVLDIGCFNGAMLQYFGKSWDKYGVEPSHAAAELAVTRGIKILGPTLDATNAMSEAFDVITAIDVIEHLVAPRAFFSKINQLLKPGGVLILATADARTWPWRWEGSRYWYCSLPEHVCFWSRPSIQYLAEMHSWRLCSYQTLRHQVSDIWQIFRDFARAVFFITARKVNGFGFPSLQRKLNRSAPTWITAPDHMLCVLQKE